MSPRRQHAIRVTGLALPLIIYTLLGFLKSLPALGFVTQAGLLAALGAWWVWRVAARRGLALTPLSLPLVAYLAAVTVATAASIDPRASLDAPLTVLALILFFFLFCDLLLAGWSPQVFTDALLAVVTVLLIEALGFLVYWYIHWYTLRVPGYPLFPIQAQIYGVADHPNLLAGLINLALPFAILQFAAAAQRSSTLSDPDSRFCMFRYVSVTPTDQIIALAAECRPEFASLAYPAPVTAPRRKAWRWDPFFGWAAWLLAATVVLYYTSSRAAWLASATVIAITVGWLAVRDGAGLPHRGSVRRWLADRNGLWLPVLTYLTVFGLLFAVNIQTSRSEYTANAGGVTAGRGVLWQVAWESFRGHPLTGTGPLTFIRSYVDRVPFARANSYTPNHAHNLLLDTLAQAGILGGLALVWLLVAGVRACLAPWRVTRRLKSRQPLRSRSFDRLRTGSTPTVLRFYTTLQTPANLQPSTFQPATVPSPALLVAASAALAGFLVHSVFDLITWLPSIGLIVMLLAALAMHAAAALRPGSYSPRVARLATAAAVLALVAFGPALTRAESAREALAQAIRSAGAGDWSAAAASMEQAVAADPRNVHYLRQRAFAYGVLAASATAPVDRAAVHKALGSYAALLRLQATWAPDLLNAGMLYQLAGDAAETERLWAAALPRWQAWPLPSLVLGDWYASQGRGEEAYNLFESALARNVRSGDTAACRRNPVCLRLSQTLPIPSATIGDVHRDARRLLDDGQAAQALSALQSVPASTRSSLIWIDRAEAHIALGQGRAAAYALETALTLEGNNGADTASRLALLRAGLFTLQPDYPAAIAALESVVRPRLVILPYDLVNRQFSLPGILVPRLAMLERSQDDLEAYERLSQLYRLVGREDDAQWASAQATALAAELAEKPQPLTRASDTSGTRPVQQPDSR